MARGAIYGRLIIKGEIECLTGLHIGVETKSTEIGGLDAPVVRDPVTMEPYIPGSSLKGKLRAIAEKREFVRRNCPGDFFNKEIRKGEVAHHECDSEDCVPCRVFGTSRDKQSGVEKNRPARLMVRDGRLLNADKLKDAGTGLYAEVKMENSLDRISSAASPRQIERVLRGARFDFELTYNIESPEEVLADVTEILACLRLLEDDYLGGSGSRGYGKIKFDKMSMELRSLEYYSGKQEPEVIGQGSIDELEHAADERLRQLKL